MKKLLANFKNRFLKSQAGFSLIELLLTIGVVAVFLPTLLVAYSATREGRPQMEQRLKATALVKEGEEAVRVVAENWDNLPVGGQYQLKNQSNTWTVQASLLPEPVPGGFSRSITVTPVYRNTDGYVTDTGTLDPSTKKVTVTVKWTSPYSSSVSSSILLTRYGNATHIDTTQAQFQLGTGSNISITDTGDGEITLAQYGGGGDWCSPNITIHPYDIKRQSVPTAISASYGNAYTATGVNASGVSLDHINITDPTDSTPPVPSESGYYNNYKSYGLYVDPSTSRAYITSDHPSLTVDIVDTNTNQQITTYADSGGESGVSVYVSGTVGYVTTEKSNGSSTTLYAFDTTKTPGKELGKISLVGSGKRVIVIGQYAYVVTSNTTAQLQIIDVSDPTKMKTVTTMNMGNGAAGVDLSLDDAATAADLVTNNVAGKSDFFVINLTNRTITKSYSTGSMNPRGVAFVPGGWTIVVGDAAPQYQVFKTSTTATTPCGTLSNPDGASTIYAVDYVQEPDGDVFSYILTNNSTNEFQIIQGGPGAGGSGTYVSSGTYTSHFFDAGSPVAFNTFSVVTDPQPNTATEYIEYKIAIKNPISGDCSTVTFTNTDFVPLSPGILPLSTIGSGYTNPGRCLEYQALLYTTDPTVSPTLYSISFNYSK